MVVMCYGPAPAKVSGESHTTCKDKIGIHKIGMVDKSRHPNDDPHCWRGHPASLCCFPQDKTRQRPRTARPTSKKKNTTAYQRYKLQTTLLQIAIRSSSTLPYNSYNSYSIRNKDKIVETRLNARKKKCGLELTVPAPRYFTII